jgi:hypothetical protein
LIAQHDPTLKTTTDISMYSTLFQSKFTSGSFEINGHDFEDDYIVPEFSLAELGVLKRKQAF